MTATQEETDAGAADSGEAEGGVAAATTTGERFVRVLPFAVVPLVVLGVLPALVRRLTGATTPHDDAVGHAGNLAIAAGTALAAWSIAELVRGGSSPAPYDPPDDLVATGPYYFSRNPMYVAALAVLFGQALRYRSLALVGYALAVAALFDRTVRRYEESRLRAQLGPAYDDYRRAVPRWLLR